LLGALDILGLRGLITTAQEDDQNLTSLDKVQSVAGSTIDAQLSDAIEEFGVA